MMELGNSGLGVCVGGRRGEATEEGQSFQKSGLKCQPKQSCFGLWSQSGSLFSEVSAVLQAVHASGQCG